jgi:splicing factor 3B subunit 3
MDPVETMIEILILLLDLNLSHYNNQPLLLVMTFLGCRRGTPGQYLASDPKGRAVMIAAIEKRKLVYVLNRDATGKPTIASPLEAHRTRTLTFATVGLDNGYDNPIFATLELQYPDVEDSARESVEELEKQLAYYELDLGLNHVSRRWATTVHRSAFCLAALPGGADGPGGVLVGGEDWIEYAHEAIAAKPSESDVSDRKSHRIVCAVPRRELHPEDKGLLITKLTMHKQKKSKFFALAQNEMGDVYKVDIDVDPDDKAKVIGMTVSLLDVLPVANALNVSKLGFLFVAAEFGDHNVYRFERIDLPDVPKCTSDECKKAFLESTEKSEAAFFNTANAAKLACKFSPSVLKNLRKQFTIESSAPTTGILVGELAGNEVSPQIYTLNGRGASSSLRIIRHGAAVTELAVSDLPGVPGGIFTIADNSEGVKTRNDRFIVVSFADATLVLRVGETVEEVGKESGLETSAPTLACTALGNDGGMVQVHPAGVRHIQQGRAKQWHCPGLKRIEYASANESQVLIALAGGEVIYFELDPVSGNLTEAATRDMGADVCCLDVGTMPPGRSRSLFAAVGCRDQTVRIVSLDPNSKLVQRSSTALKSRPHSVAFQVISEGKDGFSDTILTIGLDDGSSLRANVDPVTGAIGTSPARRFLGARPVSIARVSLESSAATLLLSSRSWISRLDPTSGKHIMAPLSYVPLDHGCSFNSEVIQDGIVATAGKTLRILSVDTTGMGGGEDEAFNVNKVDLRYTPRQMALLAGASSAERNVMLAVVESDYNEYGFEEKKSMGFDFTGEGKIQKKSGDGMDMDEDSDDEEGGKNKDKGEADEEDEEEKESRKTPIRGPYPPGPGYWGSCVRLLDPSNNCQSLDCIELNRNEAALCCTSVRFHSRGGEPLLAVGCVTGMSLHPMKQTESNIALYRVLNGERLQLVHRTKVDDGPVLSLAHFQGRLLAGIGKTLRLYEMGKRQLLRKCELRGLTTMIKSLQTAGDRAFCADMLQSIQIVRYDSTANRLILIAQDPTPRPLTAQELLDWNTVAVGDKFGNICILRLPRGAEAAAAVDLSGQRALWDSSREDNTPKLEVLCHYHVGEVVTDMTRASLVAGGAESLIYVTVTGRIGALVPFRSRDDVEFYTLLENSLRTEAVRPTGRDPQAYRSYYAPVKHVVDGDLCAAFGSLSFEQQSKIAEAVDRPVGEIAKKLEDTRNALL